MISKTKYLNKLLDWLWSHIPVICWSTIHWYVTLWSQINLSSLPFPLMLSLALPIDWSLQFQLNSRRVICCIAYSAVKHSMPFREGVILVFFPLYILCAHCGTPKLSKNYTFLLENNAFVPDCFGGGYCLTNDIEKMNSAWQMFPFPHNISEQAKELWRMFHK